MSAAASRKRSSTETDAYGWNGRRENPRARVSTMPPRRTKGSSVWEERSSAGRWSAVMATATSMAAQRRKIHMPALLKTTPEPGFSGLKRYQRYAAAITGHAKYWMRTSRSESDIQRRKAASMLQAMEVHSVPSCRGMARDAKRTVRDRLE